MCDVPKQYKRASLFELRYVFEMRMRGYGIRQMARETKRSASTIRAWINDYRHPKAHIWEYMNFHEKAKYVYEQMKAKRKRSRSPIRDEEVREHIIECLANKDTPERIAETMADRLGGKKVCFKTIYNFTKKERGLKKYLYEKGKKRRQKVTPRKHKKKQGAPKVRSIRRRSEKANKRLEPGHLEGDLIITKKGGSKAILSVIDRLNRVQRQMMCAGVGGENVGMSF